MGVSTTAYEHAQKVRVCAYLSSVLKVHGCCDMSMTVPTSLSSHLPAPLLFFLLLPSLVCVGMFLFLRNCQLCLICHLFFRFFGVFPFLFSALEVVLTTNRVVMYSDPSQSGTHQDPMPRPADPQRSSTVTIEPMPTEAATGAGGTPSDAQVERALFSGATGADASPDLDAYEQQVVQDILPESRRGSRSSRVTSRVDPLINMNADDTDEGEGGEDDTHNNGDAEDHTSDDVPVREFLPDPAQPHTTIARAETRHNHHNPSLAPVVEPWDERDWAIPPPPPQPQPAQPRLSSDTHATDSTDSPGPSHTHAREGTDGVVSLPPSWMRPTLEDIAIEAANAPPTAEHEPRPEGGVTQQQQQRSPPQPQSESAEPSGASGGGGGGGGPRRDDPFSDPTDSSVGVGVVIGPSAPGDDDYSNLTSHNSSTTARTQTHDWHADPFGEATEPMTVIEVGGHYFGASSGGLPPTMISTNTSGGSTNTDTNNNNTNSGSATGSTGDDVSPSAYFRRALGGLTAADHDPSRTSPPSAELPQSAQPDPSHPSPTASAGSAPVAVEVAVNSASGDYASDSAGGNPQGLRARNSTDANERAGSRPRVTFRDEVEEFSAPRLPSTTEEDIDIVVDPRNSPGRCGRGRSADREPAPATVLTPNELQELRLRSFMESAQPPELSGAGGGGGGDHGTANAGDAPSVSTLDFLKETSNVILPDFMNQMFASTSSFFERSKEKVAGAVPEPLKKAADKTQRGVSMALDFTSDVIGSAPAYIARVIPRSVMSDATKHLVFVDFTNVMRCCVNVNLLVVPFVFRAAGLAGAIIALAVTAVVGCYGSESFFAAKHQLRDAAYVVTYGDVPRLTWGRWFNGLSMAYSTLFLIAFTAYAASNALMLLNMMGMSGGGAVALSVIIPPLCSFPFVMCKRAKSVAAMGSLSTLLIVAAIIMLFVVLPYSAVPLNTIPIWPSTVTDFFVGLNIAVYVFSPLTLAVPIERTMAPRRFTWLLRLGTLIAYLLAIAFGLCVYLSLTTNTCSVLPVSIHRQMGNTIHMRNVDAGLSAVLFFAFIWFIPSIFFSLGELCDQRVLGLRMIPSYWQFMPNLVRFLYLAFVSLVAYVVPYFGIWVALGGALGCSVASILIPASLDYVRRERVGFLKARLPRWWELLVVFLSIVFGLAVILVGGVLSVFAMWAVVQAGAITTC